MKKDSFCWLALLANIILLSLYIIASESDWNGIQAIPSVESVTWNPLYIEISWGFPPYSYDVLRQYFPVMAFPNSSFLILLALVVLNLVAVRRGILELTAVNVPLLLAYMGANYYEWYHVSSLPSAVNVLWNPMSVQVSYSIGTGGIAGVQTAFLPILSFVVLLIVLVVHFASALISVIFFGPKHQGALQASEDQASEKRPPMGQSSEQTDKAKGFESCWADPSHQEEQKVAKKDS